MQFTKQKTIFALTLLTLTSFAWGAPVSYNFAGIQWGLTKTVVKAQMAVKGYKYTRTDEEGDLWFKGTVSQERAEIVAAFTPTNQLVQMQIILSPDEYFLSQRYKILNEALQTKYGRPDKNQLSFASPYKQGDGFENQAVKQGKATLKASWFTEWLSIEGKRDEVRYIGLAIEADRSMHIYITYSSRGWKAEYNRRYKKNNEDL